jgi:anti-sigma-K factor RskA
MHSIPRDADNAAAAAWREGTERTVAAQGQSPGALVTPILTAEGCVGVLAAETRHAAEQRETTRAVAAIIAAQLATLVTTLPAEQTHS